MPKKNIYRRSDGRWEARVSVGKDPASGKPKFKSFYGKTKAEAEQKRTEFKKYQNIKLEKSKFADICRAWLVEKTETLKQSSISAYESRLQKYIIPYFGNMCYAEADSSEAGFMQNLKEDQSISENFCKELVTLYRTILYWWHGKGNHKITSQKNQMELSFFTAEELREIQKRLSKHSIELSILLYTGMTLGELSALKWVDCDLENRIIRVARILQRVTDSTVNETSKTRLIETEITPREIPIAEGLMKIMESVAKSKRKGYVATGNGTPMDPRTIQYRVTKFLQEIDLDGSPSQFRDSFAVNAIRKGINPLFIAKVMGITAVSFFNKYQVPLEENMTPANLRTVVETL